MPQQKLNESEREVVKELVLRVGLALQAVFGRYSPEETQTRLEDAAEAICDFVDVDP